VPSAESSGAGGFGEHSRRVRELDAAWRPLLTFALAILVGVLAGALGAAFRLAVVGVQTHLSGFYAGAGGAIGASWLLPILGTAALVWLAIFIVRRFAPEAGGSGVQEIEGALEGLRPLRWRRLLPVKFAGGLCSLGAGMVLGREGPTIQMGGSLGKMIADRWSLPDAVMRTLVAAGAGAGLTAAFNAPLAGVLFVIEEMRPQFEYSFTSLQSVVLACAAADIVVRALTGQGPVLPVTDFAAPVLASLWWPRSMPLRRCAAQPCTGPCSVSACCWAFWRGPTRVPSVAATT
jgi:CIC family chloride channel protein